MRTKLFILFLLGFSVLVLSATTDENKAKVRSHISFMDSTLTDIIWCGEENDDDVILVLTENGSIYRSEDKGFNFNKLTDIFLRSGYLELEDKKDKVGTVSRMLHSPKDKKMVIFQGTKGINWITEDCGKNIKAMNQGRNVNEFMFHPTERTWLLAAAWTICEDFEDRPCEIFKELFVSFDLGEKWDLIEDYVVQFSWGVVDESFYPNVPKERILLAHEPLGKGHQQITGWSEKVHLSYTDDFFKTTHRLSSQGNKFLLTNKYLFIAKVVDEDSQDVTLQIADPKSKIYELKEVQMPVKRLKDHSYTILDSSEGQVFLHINHYGSKSKHGNIYISDSSGTRFSLSLLHSVRNLDGQCDFEKVNGIDGVYLANVYDQKKIELLRGADNSAIPGETISKKQRDKTESHYEDLENYRQTVISFDKGGIWRPLAAPLKDSDGKKITCPDDTCSLHLHSITNLRFGPFYSTSNSVGIVMGTGNVGYHLSNRADTVNTYLSRDAGVTWFEVKKGSHIYEIGDHGGLIVMAPDQEASNKIYYTWNEGLSWEELKISEDPFEITNIIIEPSNTETAFIVYGESTKGKGVIVSLDFEAFHAKSCQGHDKPNEESSDYEIWTPTATGSKCLLGRKISYVRRKREAQCFNGEEFERPTFVENCACTEEDWECDLGYAREKDGPCKLTNPNKENSDYKPPQNCSSFYFVSQGYRKVAGDVCVGGVNHEPLRIPCPGMGTLSNTNLSVLFVLVLLIAAIILVGTNNPIIEKIKDLLSEFINKNSQYIKGSPLKGNGVPPYKQFDQIPDSSDVDFTKMVFEENDDRAEPIEEKNYFEDNESNGRRKLAERKALQAAAKPVPTLGRPKKRMDEEEGDLLDFDPRK